MEALRCGQGDGFLNMSTMKIPSQFLYVKNRSLDECIAECTSNCSCTAYAYANMSTKVINGDETRCLLWTRDLIDMEKLIGQGETLYIRVNGLSGTVYCFCFSACVGRYTLYFMGPVELQ